MNYVATEESKLMRDADSRGLVSTDFVSLRQNRTTRTNMKSQRVNQEANETRFERIDARIDRCEQLLQELVKHMSQLVANHGLE